VERAKELKEARRCAFISGNDVAEISVAAGAAMSLRVVACDLSIDTIDPEYHLSPEATVDPSRDVLKQKGTEERCLLDPAELDRARDEGRRGEGSALPGLRRGVGPHDEIRAHSGMACGKGTLITQGFYAPAPAPPAVSDAATIMPKLNVREAA